MTIQKLRKIVKESCWHFRKVFEGDDAYDPKPFDKFNALSCVLEFIQNALDAIRKGLKKVKVNIRAEYISLETFKKHFLVNNFEIFLANGIRAAHKEIPEEQRVLCLILEDYNTTGILGDPERFKSKLENGDENSIHQFNHEIGGGRKLTNADFGGSEGEGRQTYCQSSNLSTFFYYTVRDDGSEYFMGMHYSGIFEYAGDTYKAFSHFGNLVESEQEGGKPFVVPISDKKLIEQYKKIFNLKRTEPGTDIIIPFIDGSTISLDNIEKVILSKYRVAVAKDELEIKLQKKTIDKNNISLLCSEREKNHDLGKKMTKEYFDFLNDSFKNGLKSNKLIFNPSSPTVINKVENLNEEILADYRNNKIIKFNVPFKIYKKKIIEKKITNHYEEIESSFNIYIKKFSDISEQFKLNDTIRGNMPIEDIRQLSSNFILTDIQDKEAKLLVKTGEVANHSKIKVKHGKFKNLYKAHSQIPVMTFINNVVKSMQNLFLDDVDDLDEKTTMDLCSIESDLDFDKNKTNESENLEDEKKEEDKVKKSEDELPRIPGKLKAYRAYPDQTEIGPIWKAVGVKYTKKQISSMKEETLKALEARQEKLKKEKDQLNFNEKQTINKEIITAENRFDDLIKFESRGYTFFPIKIYLSAAFDDGSSDPYTSYCAEDFDFNNSKKFKFRSSGSVSLTKNNENKITYEASSEDFQLSISGFGTDSEEKILIRHNYRSLT